MTKTTTQLAYENGHRDAANGDEARPGCTISPRGKSYMRGYIDGARS